MARKYSEKFRENQAPSFQLGFSNEYRYSIPALESISRRANKSDWREIKEEYTRMRDVAQKRLKRLMKSEFSDSKAVKLHPDMFPRLRDLDPRDLPKAFNDLYRFVRASTSTVYGQRQAKEKTIEKFNNAGFEAEGFDLREGENFKQFISVMEKVRKFKITYGSDYTREFTDMIMHLPKNKRRSAMAMSRMRRLMEIAHNAEAKEAFEQMVEEKEKNNGKRGKKGVSAEDMDTFLKNMGY